MIIKTVIDNFTDKKKNWKEHHPCSNVPGSDLYNTIIRLSALVARAKRGDRIQQFAHNGVLLLTNFCQNRIFSILSYTKVRLPYLATQQQLIYHLEDISA